MATRQRLSKHFIVEEFDCHDGTKVQPRDYDGLKFLCRTYLEPLRAQYGSVTILSGYRTRKHNASVGGAKNSFHVYTMHDGNDQAADIRCRAGTPRQWHRSLAIMRRVKRNRRGGLGLYKNFVHVDIRDYQADWRG